jgi:FMN phosphatase YigB (HAD superfamily)
MKPKVIFVDWDGTLSNSRFWEGCNTPSLSPEVINSITTFLFRDSKDLVNDWMTGLTASSRVIDIVADQFKLKAHELNQELERSCRNMKFMSIGIPNKIRQIQEQGTKVVIATDNMDTFDDWTVPSLKLDSIFDGILNSPRQGVLKSEIREGISAFFSPYFMQQGLKPTESVLIDNRLSNNVLESIGIEFIHINSDYNLDEALDSLSSSYS